MFSFLTSLSIWGTVVNAVTVVLGSVVGLVLRRFAKAKKEGSRLSELPDMIMKGVGLCVLLIGVQGAIKTNDIMIVIFSMLIGAFIGTLLDLDGGINWLGDFLEKKAKGRFGNVAQGFVSASLLFCVGSMAIVGSLNSGLLGDHSMIYAKSVLDMVMAVVFASTLGFGVVFSAILVFLYQGAITLGASFLAPVLSSAAINEMTAVGSLIIIGLALNLLGITKIKVMNYVPAIFVPILLVMFM